MENILANLSSDEQATIMAQSTIKRYDKDSCVFKAGDKAEHLYLLKSGQIFVCDISAEGHRNILTIISDSLDCFGEVYLFATSIYPYEAVCAKSSEIIAIPKQVIVENKQLLVNMNTVLARKALTLSKKIQLMMKDDLRRKIVEYLAHHQKVYLKRYELADYLGVSRPALSKELYRMVDEGIIEMKEDGMLKLLTRLDKTVM